MGFLPSFGKKTPKNEQRTNKKPSTTVDPRELKKNHSTNDILDGQSRRMNQDIKTKDEKLAKISIDLERYQTECKKLKQHNEDLTTGVKKLQEEIAAQELLVRLERGDFEELKAKEAEYIKLLKENKKLNDKVKDLENSQSDDIDQAKARRDKTEEKLRKQIDEINKENEKLRKEQKEGKKAFQNLTRENQLVQDELKNALKAQAEMEKTLQKLQASEAKMTSDKDAEIAELKSTVAELETRLAETKGTDLTQRAKDQEISSLKATIESLNQNDKNKDSIIAEKEQSIQNLRYKLKDAQETYESQWEEMMMMTERQLKAVRAEKSDTAATKQLKSEIRALQTKLQNKEDEKSQLSKEVTDLKRKVRNIEAENRVPKSKFDDAVQNLNEKISDLEDRLKDESYARIEEKRVSENVIRNLQGHMINIYTGNIPVEMAQMLDTIVKIKLSKKVEA